MQRTNVLQMDWNDRGITDMKRLLYFCSFVPYQLLEHNGFQMVCAYNYDGIKMEQTFLSGNPCSFIKECEYIDYRQFDGVIFTNCCNSTQRLHDYIKYRYPHMFVYLLEIPRLSGNNWNYNNLLVALKKYFHFADIKYPVTEVEKKSENGKILVISSSLSRDYAKQLSALYSKKDLKFYTCWSEPRGDLYQAAKDSVFCARMTDYVEQIKPEIMQAEAVIFITMAKCDYVMFSYPAIRQICKQCRIRFLHMEEEFTNTISENSRIRYEAFKECMSLRLSGNE